MSKFHTSPLLFLRPAGKSTIEGRPLDKPLTLREIELLSFYNEPATLEKGVEAGFDNEMIEKARQLGLLTECDDSGFGRGSTWEVYNLQRAAYLMFACLKSAGESSFRPHLKQIKNGIAESFGALLKRRTERFFTDQAVPLTTLEEIASEVQAAIGDNHWLSFRVLVQTVEGLKPGVYRLSSDSGKLESCLDHYTRKDLLECLHGQWWLNGGGVCWFFVVSFDELAKHAETNPKNYFEMILLLGEAGQALVNAVYKRGLGTWMTPAVSESLSGKILGLDSNQEALYFFKVGIPERAKVETEERRSPI